MERWIKDWGLVVLLMFIGAGILLGFDRVINLFKSDSQLANAYVAFGTLTLALATIALAIITQLSIKSGYDREKRNRKERLLNEIIDWAVDVTKGELLMEFADVRGIKDIQWSRLYLYTTVDKLQFSFRQARTRGLYISGIVSILGADLHHAVGELIKNLEVHIQSLKECMDAINSPACETTLYGATSAATKTTDSKKLLDESATKVLEEATKIKTRNIS